MDSRIVIDCDASPHVPDCWSVDSSDMLEHVVRGPLDLNTARIDLIRLEGCRFSGIIEVSEVEFRLWRSRRRLLPAPVLDWFLDHPEQIPKAWKEEEGGTILFLGTHYRDHADHPMHRGLTWDRAMHTGQWGQVSVQARNWPFMYPIAILADDSSA